MRVATPTPALPRESTIPAAEVPAPARRRPRGVRVYTPGHRYAFRLLDLWRYRGLLRYFGKLYVKRRYRRTWLGWIWVPLRPSADMAGRVLLFGGLLSVS